MRLRPWQQATLFVVGLAGSVFMLVAPYVSADVQINPAVVTIFGGIVAFVLTSRNGTGNGGSGGGGHRRDGGEPE